MESDCLETTRVPVNAYSTPISECGYSQNTLLNVYRDMLLIREFETAIASSHDVGAYGGREYRYSGPAHLCIGQEAVAVGEALSLNSDDLIFGTHRSHGELLARGLRFAETASEKDLSRVLTDVGAYVSDGIKSHFTDDNRKNLVLFTLYGAFAEIFGRKTGFQHGLGGSMHAYYLPFGVYPNNAIVGGSAPLASGAALFKRVNAKNGVAVANLGDGAMACGAVYEAMNFASMKQFRTMWKESRGLPLIFAVTDNIYARGGNTHTETSGMGTPARLGLGINDEAMHSEVVNGSDPLAVADAFNRKKLAVSDGKGPALLVMSTYRFSGHSLGDNQNYRSRSEVEEHLKSDPIPLFRSALIRNGIASESDLDDIGSRVSAVTAEAFGLAADESVSPINIDIYDENYLKSITINTNFGEIFQESPHKYVATGNKPRAAVTYRDAIAEAVEDAFAMDKTLVAYGEDVRGYDAKDGIFTELDKVLPYERLFNAPISESSIIGSATGYAMCGGRVVTELLYADFLTRGADELINQLAKWKGLSGGETDLKVTLRLPVGKGYGAQHSQDPVSIISGVPGLIVIYPATPYDAKGLLCSALTANAPVAMPESRELYSSTEAFHPGGVPDYFYKLPIGVPDIKQSGTDITILTIGGALYKAVEASKALPDVSAEIIDARTVTPFDYDILNASVRKTGRLIVAGECTVRSSILNDFAANVSRACFDFLTSPVLVVGAPDTIIPNSANYYSLTTKIIDAIRESLKK